MQSDAQLIMQVCIDPWSAGTVMYAISGLLTELQFASHSHALEIIKMGQGVAILDTTKSESLEPYST